MDSRKRDDCLTFTQAEQPAARWDACGTRISGDPGAASLLGMPSAAIRARGIHHPRQRTTGPGQRPDPVVSSATPQWR
ncbi:MAG: hypothetical protein AMXMBFR55_22220 [Gemmatimonadota bacterium]